MLFQLLLKSLGFIQISLQVTRSLGDAYLKDAEFNREPLPLKFRLPEPFLKPILIPEPSISVLKLCPEDQFLIFASDGLWEHLSNQEAVDIVNSYPRKVRKMLLKKTILFNQLSYTKNSKKELGSIEVDEQLMFCWLCRE